MDQLQLVLDELREIKATLAVLAEAPMVKEWYTTAEVVEIVRGRWAEYTIREFARKGQIFAKKSPSGRGWLIPHDELVRLRNEGPTPEHLVNPEVNGKGNNRDLRG